MIQQYVNGHWASTMSARNTARFSYHMVFWQPAGHLSVVEKRGRMGSDIATPISMAERRRSIVGPPPSVAEIFKET
jgi:hypothetical protein